MIKYIILTLILISFISNLLVIHSLNEKLDRLDNVIVDYEMLRMKLEQTLKKIRERV